MAGWTLVQQSAAQAVAATSVSLPAASKAGNLLIATVGAGSGTAITGSAGWTAVKSATNSTVSETYVFAYFNNPGGITTFTMSGPATGLLTIAEYTCTGVALITGVSDSGSNTGQLTTTLNITTGGTSKATDLVIVAATHKLASAATLTWTDPSGFTENSGLSTASSTNHEYAAYELSAGSGGTQSVTVTASAAATNNGWSGVVVTFSVPTAPAWSLVQQSAAQTLNGTNTLPASSTAGNLLIAIVTANSNTAITGPANWTLVKTAGPLSTVNETTIWAYFNNPGGLSSFTFSGPTGAIQLEVGEFTCPGVNQVTGINDSGTVTGGSVATVTVTTAGSAKYGDLVIAGCLEHLSAAAAITWTDPANFAEFSSLSLVSNVGHNYGAYRLAVTSPGAQSVVFTSSVSSGTANGWTAAVVTFSLPSGVPRMPDRRRHFLDVRGTASVRRPQPPPVTQLMIPVGPRLRPAFGMRSGTSRTPGLVQRVYQVYAGGYTAGTAKVMPISTAAGDGIVVTANSSGTTTGVTDSRGNTYLTVSNDSGQGCAMYAATYNGVPGNPTLPLRAGTDTLTVSGTNGNLQVAGVRSVAAKAPDASPAFTHGTSTAASGPATGTLPQAGDVIVYGVLGTWSVQSGGVTAFAGGIQEFMAVSSSGNGNVMAYGVNTGTASMTPSATMASSEIWIGLTVALAPYGVATPDSALFPALPVRTSRIAYARTRPQPALPIAVASAPAAPLAGQKAGALAYRQFALRLRPAYRLPAGATLFLPAALPRKASPAHLRVARSRQRAYLLVSGPPPANTRTGHRAPFVDVRHAPHYAKPQYLQTSGPALVPGYRAVRRYTVALARRGASRPLPAAAVSQVRRARAALFGVRTRAQTGFAPAQASIPAAILPPVSLPRKAMWTWLRQRRQQGTYIFGAPPPTVTPFAGGATGRRASLAALRTRVQAQMTVPRGSLSRAGAAARGTLLRLRPRAGARGYLPVSGPAIRAIQIKRYRALLGIRGKPGQQFAPFSPFVPSPPVPNPSLPRKATWWDIAHRRQQGIWIFGAAPVIQPPMPPAGSAARRPSAPDPRRRRQAARPVPVAQLSPFGRRGGPGYLRRPPARPATPTATLAPPQVRSRLRPLAAIRKFAEQQALQQKAILPPWARPRPRAQLQYHKPPPTAKAPPQVPKIPPGQGGFRARWANFVRTVRKLALNIFGLPPPTDFPGAVTVSQSAPTVTLTNSAGSVGLTDQQGGLILGNQAGQVTMTNQSGQFTIEQQS